MFSCIRDGATVSFAIRAGTNLDNIRSTMSKASQLVFRLAFGRLAMR
jgi:hypothetical protein